MYGELTAWFRDRIPLRTQGIRADAWIDLHVFADSPNHDVLLGDDGWLFLRGSVRQACRFEDVPRADIVETVAKIDRVVRASGRNFVFMVAPNQEAIYPELTGGFEDLAECAREGRAELRSLFSSAGLPGYIDMWGPIEALKTRSEEPVYFPQDTHWTWASALLATELMLDSLRPGVFDLADVTAVPNTAYDSELSKLIGLPEDDIATQYFVRRGVDIEEREERGRNVPTRYVLAEDLDAIEGRTVVIHDSFGELLEPMARGLFDDSTWMQWRLLERMPNGGGAWLAERAATSDTLIFQTVERTVYQRFGVGWAQLPGLLAGALKDDLRHLALDPAKATGKNFVVRANGRIAPDGGNPSVRWTIGPGRPGVERYVVVELTADEGGQARLSHRPEGGRFGAREIFRARVRPIGPQQLAFDLSDYPESEEILLAPREATVTAVFIVEVDAGEGVGR